MRVRVRDQTPTNLCWFDKHSSDNVRAVRLVSDAKATDDGTKVQPLIVTDGTESQLIFTAALDDRRVADLHLKS